ncbi:MAG: hypothetical protein JXA71_08730, partial [Chitinispirillaceae bacterium]|nr:hypothetical protein [Chitinispirillaceae bacterium]
DRIPISSQIIGFSAKDAFLVKAKGDSMVPRIHSGDLCIVKRTSIAENGSIVVCINDEMAIIKKFQKENEKVFLISLNSAFAPILPQGDFRIEGIVKGVLSYKI